MSGFVSSITAWIAANPKNYAFALAAASIASLAMSLTISVMATGLIFWLSFKAIQALRLDPTERTPLQWMYIGVWTSIWATLTDGSYWWNAWNHAYFHLPETRFWFDNGVFSNVLFRQGLGVYALYAHYRAFTTPSSWKYIVFVRLAGWAGAVYGVWLVLNYPGGFPWPN